jgi:transketolase
MKKYTNTGSKDTRSGFGAGLTELGQKNENVVALCADLIGSLKMDEFKKNHPDRFFQVGIAEANMIGIAAGLTIGGKIPFTGTFANFSTGRVYDQIRQSVAYAEKKCKNLCISCWINARRRWSYTSNTGRYWVDENVAGNGCY